MDLVINFAPTGMVPTREMSPHVPLQPNEIIEQVLSATQLGVTIVHLHARDADGRPTYDRDVYARIIAGIREHAPDLMICVSLSGRDYSEFEKRSHPLSLDGDVKPDMGSLTLSSLNFPRQASVNAPDMVRRLAEAMAERDIIPELEVFDLGMANYANYLIKKEIVATPCYVNVILGNIAGAQCTFNQIGSILQALDSQALWSLGGIGAQQLPAIGAAVAMGGGVRVGLEDNLYLNKSLTTNSQLLQRVHMLAEVHGRQVMSSGDLRRLLCPFALQAVA